MADERKPTKPSLFGDDDDEDTDDLFVSAIDTTPRNTSSISKGQAISPMEDTTIESITPTPTPPATDSFSDLAKQDVLGGGGGGETPSHSNMLGPDDGEEIRLDDDDEPPQSSQQQRSDSASPRPLNHENGFHTPASTGSGQQSSGQKPHAGPILPEPTSNSGYPQSSNLSSTQTPATIQSSQHSQPATISAIQSAPSMNSSSPITAPPPRGGLLRDVINGENGGGATAASGSGDQHQIEIKVSDPQKVGDGMSSYMTYRILTKTNLPYFRRQSLSVTRRFSDFLGLRERLAEKHLNSGRIVPPAPEKSAVGMVQVKMSKEDTAQQADFIEKRRASLERFINRVAAHPALRTDPDFREFLELETDLPRANSTSALSGAGVKRFLFKMGDSVNKMTFRMDESDPWFDDKLHQVDALDSQLRKLLASVEALIHHRRELVNSTSGFSRSSAMLGNCEEHTGLSCALSQLAETEERLESIYADQASNDYLLLGELLRDYISLIGAVKEVFSQRVKVFQSWIHAQQMLTKKREQKNRFELAHRTDKIGLANEECIEWEAKVKRGQEEFENISKNIKIEMERFELNRIAEFKNNIVKYMESLLETQQQIIAAWEKFLPEVKSIV